MSEKIKTRLGIDSTIEIPESLRDLFRALDFSTKYGEFQIPLNMRGDGIQSRHLPFILDYIASKSNQHHIWGYEEPENSLELSKAFEMSRDFVENFSRENQIYLTTHSPAFYDISGSRAAKWYIENSKTASDENTYTNATPINSTQDIDKSMGLLTVIAPRMRKANEELNELREDLAKMASDLAATSRPAVYVEGITDVTILSHAAKVYGIDPQFLDFFTSDGASNITQFIKVMSRTKTDQRVLMGLYDGDVTGRTELERFNSSHLLHGTNMRVVSRPNKVYVGALNAPQHLANLSQQFTALRVALPLCIEFMFRPQLIKKAQEDGALTLQQRRSKLSINELPLEVNVEDVLRGKIPDEYLYFGKKVSDTGKVRFSEWVIKQPDAEFNVFDDIMRQLTVAIQ